jgi:IclR family mhp operon transcriptional activator
MPSYKPVTAALRVLEVLEAVNQLQRARVTQIHQLTRINRPTIVRMLETLEHADFVHKDAETGSYLPSARALRLSGGYDMVSELRAVCAPMLADLLQQTGWPSDAAIFDGNAMVVVATTRKHGQQYSEVRPGYRAPVFATSLGQAFFPWASPPDRQRALVAARRSSMTSLETIEEEGELRRTMEEVRDRGFATMVHGSGVASIGVPIMDGELSIGALNVLFPNDALRTDEARLALLMPLRATATRMSLEMASRLRARSVGREVDDRLGGAHAGEAA